MESMCITAMTTSIPSIRSLLQSMPTDNGQDALYTLDRSPVNHRTGAWKTVIHCHIHTDRQLKSPINLTCRSNQR